MKVALQIAATFGGAGLGHVCYQAARGLRDAAMLARVTCAGHQKTDIDEGLISDVAGLDFPSRVIPRRLYNRLGVDPLLRQNYFGWLASRNLRGCDAAHGYTGQMVETIAAARRLGIRTVVDRPNTHVRFMERLLDAEYRKYGVPFQPYTRSQVLRETRELQECDAVVTCSDLAKQTMVDEGVDETKIHVARYGVDFETFHPEPRQDETFRVVFAGLICLRKGVQYLLDAWEKLRLDQAELVMQGHLLDDAVAVVRHYLPRCRFTILPHSADPAQLCRLYNSASVCVFPSVEDGFGMVVSEAMACNKPVIITSNMGAADIVVSGLDGLVLPPANAEAIKEALLQFYETPGSAMGQNNRERVAALTWDAYRASLMSVYAGLASQEEGGNA